MTGKRPVKTSQEWSRVVLLVFLPVIYILFFSESHCDQTHNPSPSPPATINLTLEFKHDNKDGQGQGQMRARMGKDRRGLWWTMTTMMTLASFFFSILSTYTNKILLPPDPTIPDLSKADDS